MIEKVNFYPPRNDFLGCEYKVVMIQVSRRVEARVKTGGGAPEFTNNGNQTTGDNTYIYIYPFF